MIKKIILVGLAVILFAGAATAAILFLFPYEPTQPPSADDASFTQTGVQAVVNANNKFAFDLYSELDRSEGGNIFYSPYSISAALAMTYEGAKGQTAEEIKSVFHFPESGVLRPNFAAIYNEINKKDKPYTLSTGNAVWVQQDSELLEGYLRTVEDYYGGKAANLDFAGEPEKSRQTINTFIEQQTAQRIKDLIPQGVLSAATELVLTNAIYFKGTWVWEFGKADTREQDFRIAPTNVIKAPMMHMNNEKAKFNYVDIGDLQILELPYKGDEISMLIVLPTGDLDAIAANLTTERFNEWKRQMKEEKLDFIYLPKFEFDAKYFMRDTLSALGMPTAFSERADLSGMNGTGGLVIDEAIHQAFVKVDEEGTEAAGATAVIVGTTMVLPRKVFNADHPFIFVIQEKNTGNILFLGRVVDPTK